MAHKTLLSSPVPIGIGIWAGLGLDNYKGEEGSQPRERRKSTTGRKEDDNGMDERLSREGRKSLKGRKEDYQGKDGRLSRKGTKSTKGKKEDDHGKEEGKLMKKPEKS